jgi:hypothetical protein
VEISSGKESTVINMMDSTEPRGAHPVIQKEKELKKKKKKRSQGRSCIKKSSEF